MAAPKPHFSPHAAFAALDPAPIPGDKADFAVFRLLLPASFSDADTMRLYAAVNPLRRRSAALRVRVEPLDPSSASGRVVAAVLGPAAPLRRAEASSSSSSEPLALSPAQEALLAVADTEGALHRADGESHHRRASAPGRATCLLLVEPARLDAAVGRGGLERIALDAGADVRVSPWEEGALPQGDQTAEEVVEINGDSTTVRKALVALSSCLQRDLPVGSSTTSVKNEGSILSLASSELPEPDMGTLCSEVSTECTQGSQIDCPQDVTGDVQSKCLQQISFRLLLPSYLAGGLIGKKGAIIKGIEDETGACIDVSAPVSGCMERVITICALESPESEYHIVQSALLLIFDRMMETESNARSTFDKASQSLARALVLKSQFRCLVGLGDSVIKEMVKTTGARIQILDGTKVPACASQFELVLQITGELMNVRDALCVVCWKLRNHVFSSNRIDYNNGYIPSSDTAESNAASQADICSTDNFHTVDHRPSQCYEMDSREKSFSSFELSSPEFQKSENKAEIGMQKPPEQNDIVTDNLNNGITFPEENNLARKAADHCIKEERESVHLNP